LKIIEIGLTVILQFWAPHLGGGFLQRSFEHWDREEMRIGNSNGNKAGVWYENGNEPMGMAVNGTEKRHSRSSLILTRRAKERSPDAPTSCLFACSHHLHIGHAHRPRHCW